MDLHEDTYNVIDVNEKLHQASESDDNDFLQESACFTYFNRVEHYNDDFSHFTYFNRVEHYNDEELFAMEKQSRPTSSDRQIFDDSKKVELSSNSSTSITPQSVGDDMNDIRQKVIEYEQQQIPGVQLANVGNQNLKIINNYSVTSNACSLF